MFKKYKKQLILSSIVILLPIVFGLIMWSKLPNTFVTHWGADGAADGFSSKAFAVFFIPALLLALQFICVWITDRTNRGNEQSPKVMNLIFCIMPVISLLVCGMMYAIALGRTFDAALLLPVILGLLFVVIGNYMPKCTRNSTVGIKVIWALNNEENWNATHRFAGKAWVISGLIAAFSALLPMKIGYPILFVALIGGGLLPALYSYLYYRKQVKAGTAKRTKDMPVDKRTKNIRRISLVLVIAILIGCGYFLFTGSIEYEFREDALVMDATFYAPITLRYDEIQTLEYREENVDGVRVGGFGSFKLQLGNFQNDEFGNYTRYTYVKPDSCIIITAKGKTLVFSGKDAAETEAIFNKLIEQLMP
ncbi:MAG: SdpI family protein [Oscillospiraceae bacterium]|nr:SdpI family protein [Oscillospiraceae bacterium]